MDQTNCPAPWEVHVKSTSSQPRWLAPPHHIAGRCSQVHVRTSPPPPIHKKTDKGRKMWEPTWARCSWIDRPPNNPIKLNNENKSTSSLINKLIEVNHFNYVHTSEEAVPFWFIYYFLEHFLFLVFVCRRAAETIWYVFFRDDSCQRLQDLLPSD